MKCVKCGKGGDIRLGWCFTCFDKAQKARAKKPAAKKPAAKKSPMKVKRK